MEDTDNMEDTPSDGGQCSTKAFAYIARVRVPSIPEISNIENEKPADSNILIAAPRRLLHLKVSAPGASVDA